MDAIFYVPMPTDFPESDDAKPVQQPYLQDFLQSRVYLTPESAAAALQVDQKVVSIAPRDLVRAERVGDLTPDDFEVRYQHLGQHPIYQKNEWQARAAEGKVLSGYWQWVRDTVECDGAMSREEYLAQGGTKCPHCESTHLVGGSVDVDRGNAFQEVSCLDCGRSWIDEYILTGWSE